MLGFKWCTHFLLLWGLEMCFTQCLKKKKKHLTQEKNLLLISTLFFLHTQSEVDVPWRSPVCVDRDWKSVCALSCWSCSGRWERAVCLSSKLPSGLMMPSSSSIWTKDFSASQHLNLFFFSFSPASICFLPEHKLEFGAEKSPSFTVIVCRQNSAASLLPITTFPISVCPTLYPVFHINVVSTQRCTYVAAEERKSRAHSRSVWHQPLLQRGRICVLSSYLFSRWGCHGDMPFAVLLMGVIGLHCTHTHTLTHQGLKIEK